MQKEQHQDQQPGSCSHTSAAFIATQSFGAYMATSTFQQCYSLALHPSLASLVFERKREASCPTPSKHSCAHVV
eukprot:scaffold23584_cov22-Tisochrysis_lutea.AAC.4